MNSEALIPLTQFGFLKVTGRDAQKFLQGYTTCDLEQLNEAAVQRGAICNIKGRMEANFLVIRLEDGLLLRLDKALVSTTMAFLQKYIVFSKADLHDLSDSLKCYGVMGASLTDTSVELPQALYAVADSEKGKMLKLDAGRYEFWTEQTLEATAPLEQWQQAELTAGIVWVDEDTRGEYIPQMFNLHNIDGISFDKGCYLGQEIVARMQYRGELKKRLHLAHVTDANADINAKVVNPEGKTLGNVVARAPGVYALVIKAGEPVYQLEDGTHLMVEEVAES